MPILNTLPVRAKALLQCALDFYRTAIILNSEGYKYGALCT